MKDFKITSSAIDDSCLIPTTNDIIDTSKIKTIVFNDHKKFNKGINSFENFIDENKSAFDVVDFYLGSYHRPIQRIQFEDKSIAIAYYWSKVILKFNNNKAPLIGGTEFIKPAENRFPGGMKIVSHLSDTSKNGIWVICNSREWLGGNAKVAIYDLQGNYKKQFGSTLDVSASDFVFDSKDNFYIADYINRGIIKLDKNGNYITKFATGNHRLYGIAYSPISDLLFIARNPGGNQSKMEALSTDGSSVQVFGNGYMEYPILGPDNAIWCSDYIPHYQNIPKMKRFHPVTFETLSSTLLAAKNIHYPGHITFMDLEVAGCNDPKSINYVPDGTEECIYDPCKAGTYLNVKDKLLPGDTLLTYQHLTSKNGQYRAVLLNDGNFVIYKDFTDGYNDDNKIWSSNTAGVLKNNNYSIDLTADGKLIIRYNSQTFI